MKSRLPVLFIVITLLVAALAVVKFIAIRSHSNKTFSKDENEQEARFTDMRAQYEFDMLKDPATGKIPRNIVDQELAYARTIPEKGSDGNNLQRPENLNSYNPA